RAAARDTGCMNPTDRRPAGTWRQAARLLHRAARRGAQHVIDVVEECNYAQRRLWQLRLDLSRYVLPGGDQPPDTYPEFMLRSSGALWHEPSAHARAVGGTVLPVASWRASTR